MISYDADNLLYLSSTISNIIATCRQCIANNLTAR